jgi:HSP20 family protein
MAEIKTNRTETGTEERAGLARQDREPRGMRRWDSAYGSTARPFELMDRMSEEMDRLFDRFARNVGFPSQSWLSRGGFGSRAREGAWSPRIDAVQKDDRFIVHADLPGLKRDEIEVELTDDALTIRGERRDAHNEERGGYYQSEREYGQFCRTIPLPPGVISESAQASFRDGVLEITMRAAPSEANRGRKLEIADASASAPSEGKQKK